MIFVDPRPFPLWRMTPVDRVISKFGGVPALARLLGHSHPTTVYGWKDRGVIPVRQQPILIALARDKGIALEPADFFDIETRPAAPVPAAEPSTEAA